MRLSLKAYVRYQNVYIRDFSGAKEDGGGGDSWSYTKTFEAPIK